MEKKIEKFPSSSSSSSSFTFPPLLLDLNEINILPNHFEELIESIDQLNIPLLFNSINDNPSSILNPNSIHWQSLTTLNSTLRPKLTFVSLPQSIANDSDKPLCSTHTFSNFTYFDVPPLDVTKVLPPDTSCPSSDIHFHSLKEKLTLSNLQEKIHILDEVESLLTCNVNHFHPLNFHHSETKDSFYSQNDLSKPFTQDEKQHPSSQFQSSFTSSSSSLSSNLIQKVNTKTKDSISSITKSKPKKSSLSTEESLPLPLFSTEISFETQSKKFQPSILVRELSFLQKGIKRKTPDS